MDETRKLLRSLRRRRVILEGSWMEVQLREPKEGGKGPLGGACDEMVISWG